MSSRARPHHDAADQRSAAIRASHHYTVLQRFYERMFSSLAIHYPLWLPGTSTMDEALQNPNRVMAEAAGVARGMHVLDAGCGLGHSAFWLAETFGVRVTGISIADSNIERCREIARERGLDRLVHFETRDFMRLDYPDASFDVVWNLESVNYAHPRTDYLADVLRILKPGGRWVGLDGFADPMRCLIGRRRRWLKTVDRGFAFEPGHWQPAESMVPMLHDLGFVDAAVRDLTPYVPRQIELSALLGTVKSAFMLRDLRTRPDKYWQRLRLFRAVFASYRLISAGVTRYCLVSARRPD